MKKIYALCLIFSAILFVSTALANQSYASGGCSPLYNGGLTNKQFCPTPTVLPTPAPFKENLSTGPAQQTRGGQKIYPASNSKTTPDTGPEDWSLPLLALFAGFGLLLRKKSNNVQI